MTAIITSQTEPIPGYRLLERLGQGGFGEVWKAEAPGGLHKAIKIVHGNLGGSAEDEVRVRQELKALERVKSVRHPFVLSLERFDIIDNRLYIVMELADRSLLERCRECQLQGLVGIPRDEMLRYMEETAEALDLMNIQYQLQHLDIKPQNLFLVYNHIKVGDFGLVKDLEGMRAFATSGLTPVYAAPETFEGIVTRFCDQYNLAIVYQELLTGRLPFSGTSPRHLMLQHLTGEPDLSSLSAEDRPAIARALAKKPEERHPSCMALVQALRRGDSSAPVPAPVRPTPLKEAKPSALPENAALTTVHLGRPPEPPPPEATAMFTPPATQEMAPPERPEITGDGVLFPALVLGLGGAARGVLQQLRKSLHKRGGPPEALPHVRLLHLDTDPEAVREAVRGEPDTALREQEVVVARLQRPSHYLKPNRERQAAERWLPSALLSRLPRDQVTAAGCRALGRLAFVTNFAAIASRLRVELEACTDAEALQFAQRQTGLGQRTNRPRVYIVCSLGGGSGGMFLDVAYTVRHLLKQMGYARPDVVGLFLLPAAERSAAPSSSVLNAFAALTELSHFASAQHTFSADYLDLDRTLTDADSPFSRCLLLPMPPENETDPRKGADGNPLGPLASLAGDFLGRDLLTSLGPAADQARAGLPSATALTFQTFGAFWFAVPRRLLLQRVAQSLCHQLVQTWRSAGRQSSRDTFRAWIQEQFEHAELTPERLLERLQAACAPTLGQEPEAAFDTVLQLHAAGGTAELARRPQAGAEAMAEIERLVGLPEDIDTRSSPGALAQALQEAIATVSAETVDQLGEISHRVLAEPRFRLTGAEEAVQREIIAVLNEGSRAQHEAAAELARESLQQYHTATQLTQHLGKRSFLWFGNKGQVAADLFELLQLYPRTRCRSLALEWVSTLYQELMGDLHRYLREVSCCRPRITQLLQNFADPAERRQQVDLGLGRYLLPAGCRTLDEGVSRILDSLTPEELQELNDRVQAVIGRKFAAQVHLCTAPANFVKDLEEEVNEQVAAFAEAQLGRAHAAELYLKQHAEDDESALADLASAFDEAIPELAGTRLNPRNELCILAVPQGPEGEYFRKLVEQALPDREFLPAASTDDIIFYREQPDLALSSLPQFAPAVQEAYRQSVAAKQVTHHSRCDIIDWHAGM